MAKVSAAHPFRTAANPKWWVIRGKVSRIGSKELSPTLTLRAYLIWCKAVWDLKQDWHSNPHWLQSKKIWTLILAWPLIKKRTSLMTMSLVEKSTLKCSLLKKIRMKWEDTWWKTHLHSMVKQVFHLLRTSLNKIKSQCLLVMCQCLQLMMRPWFNNNLFNLQPSIVSINRTTKTCKVWLITVNQR